MGRGSCDHVACPRSPGPAGDCTRRARPAPAAPRPYLALGHPEAHVGLHAGGRAAARANPHAPALPPPRARLPGTDVMAGEAAAARPGEEEEPGGVPRPGRARTRSQSPARAPAAGCLHVPAPRRPARLLFPLSGPGCSSPLLGVTRCPSSWRCSVSPPSNAPRSHTYTPLPRSRRTHYSCGPSSPTDQGISTLHGHPLGPQAASGRERSPKLWTLPWKIPFAVLTARG